jgi:class 3 adenylate cyclase/ABC-type transport system involved in cytochrome c biogenesis ATPase subunit
MLASYTSFGGTVFSDIAQWLSELGLEKFASAFAEAEVEFADLPDLATADLKEIGLPVGPRRRVEKAIQLLGPNPDLPPPEPTIAAAEPALTQSAASEAERRHLTVMFVDLVGSTEMATQLDAEDMRNVITSYQNTVAGVVTRHDGFIARYMGDGVLCYFGWPRANEDDAERAVRAGLEIIASVKRSSGPAGVSLASRVGIATGVVIVGDLIGTGAAQEAAVVGETPNLAARLQGLAKPDQLIIAQETQNLLGNVFELESVGAQRLKGIAQAVDVYVVKGEVARESRFDARQSGTLTDIVGRAQELGLIRDCWANAKAGAGQMIVVSGEAGIGKSRITRALIDEIAQEPHVRMTFQCSPYHTDSAFFPIIQQLTFAAGIQPADSSQERLDKLERVPGIESDSVALVATLLGIDAGDRYPPLDLTPAQLRARTLQALVQLLVRQSDTQPLLAIFEDLHWVDPTTLEWLDMTLDAIADRKILLLSTARPTFEHGFGGHPIVTRFALNRLGKDQIGDIVSKLTDGKALPHEIMEIIARRTDGVPLFVEELTKTILESGALNDDGERYVLNGPLSAIAIPATLHDSLMARLDRLQPIKEVAQTAAASGASSVMACCCRYPLCQMPN